MIEEDANAATLTRIKVSRRAELSLCRAGCSESDAL